MGSNPAVPSNHPAEASVSLLYVTCGSVEEARAIGRRVVEDHLAACANILEGMLSIYRWQGKLAEETECVLILKTRSSLVEAATARVCALHSYSVPCVLELPIAHGTVRQQGDHECDDEYSGTKHSAPMT